MEPIPQIHVDTDDGRRLNKFFKALADETRREILHMLEGREYTVGEIVARFHLSQPTISRHLSVLKQADLVRDRRQGQHVWYRLNRESLAASVRQYFGEFSRCRFYSSGVSETGFRPGPTLQPGRLIRNQRP